jgi:hypothetical protein
MAERYQRLTDLFTVTCRQCGSTDVDLSVDSCGQCGDTVEAECNGCGAVFRSHDFTRVEWVRQ